MRILATVTLVLLAAIGVLIIRNGLSDPTQAQRAWLQAELEKVTAPPDESARQVVDFDALLRSVSAKPAIWRELVPPPPPKPAPPPPPPKPPDFKNLLRGVSLTGIRIGTKDNPKIRIKWPAKPFGAFVGKGDTIQLGVKIKDITDKEVIFSYMQGDQEYTFPMKRP